MGTVSVTHFEEVARAHSLTAQGSLELARAVKGLTRWMMVLVMLMAIFVGAVVYNQIRLEYFLRQTIDYYERMLGPPEYFGEEGDTLFSDPYSGNESCPANPVPDRQKI